MKKIHKKTLISIFGIVGVVGLIGGGLAVPVAKPSAENMLISDLFDSTAMQFTPACVDRNNKYTKAGLEVTGGEGASAKVNRSLAGEFSFEYLPIVENYEYTFKTLETSFCDAVSGDEFSVIVEQAEEQYNISVEIDGVRAGIYYASYTELRGETRLCNAGGRYTELSEIGSLVITFDPVTMSVYASNGDNEVLVWNMSKSENDEYDIGKKLEAFTFFDVSFTIRDVGVNDNGIFMLYGFNDVEFDNYLLEKGGTPVLAGKVREHGLVGQSYQLPDVCASDLLNNDVYVAKVLYDPNGVPTRIYNDTFIPEKAGAYTLHCEATVGTTVLSQDFSIEVYDAVPEYSYEFDYELKTEADVGETVYIPKMSISGGLNVENRTTETTVTVYRNGIRMKEYTDILGGFYYKLRGEGVYTLKYDVFGEEVEFEIVSKDEKVKFNYDKEIGYVGETLDLSQTLCYVDGEAVPYDLQVTYPSGVVYANKCFELNEAGIYTLRISAHVGVNVRTLVKEIYVYEKIADIFECAEGAEIDYAKTKITGEEGVRVHVSRSNATVVYQKEIDISKYVDQTVQTANGVTVLSEKATPFIDMAVDANEYLLSSTSEMRIALTDAEDATNSIEILIRSDGNKYISYVRGRAGETGWMGFNNRGTNMTINGAQGHLYVDGYGSEIVHSFYGAARGGYSLTDSRITLYYDNETKQLLTKPANGTSCIITDFDDKQYVTNGKLWGGFSSDKVILTITGGRPTTVAYDYFIFGIDGQKFDNSKAEYVAAPEIRLEKESVGAIKGYDIKIPEAVALDYYGQTVKTFVTKVYYEKDGVSYDVNVENGKFYAKYAGEYTVLYFAQDVFGNVSRKNITVNVLDSIGDIVLDYSEPLGEEYTSSLTGESTVLYDADDLVVTNEIGSCVIERKVTNKATQEQIFATQGTIVFEKSGVYTVTYTATDELGRSATLAYDIVVEKSNKVIVSSPLPEYVGFAYGNSYTLQDVYVKDYTNDEPTLEKAEIYVNGEKLTGNVLDFEYKTQPSTEVETVETIEVVYKFNAEEIAVYEVSLKTVYTESIRFVGKNEIVTENIKMERYFVLEEGMTATAAKDNITLEWTNDDSLAWFIQAVSSTDVSLTFDIAETRTASLSPLDTNIKSVTVWLMDAVDKSKTLKFRYEEQETGNTRVWVNDTSLTPETAGNFKGTVTDEFTMNYKNAASSLFDASGQLQKITTYFDGRSFEGFSDKVYIAIGVERLDDTLPVSLKVKSVSGQTLSNVSKDSVAPYLELNGECGGTYIFGDKLVIPSAKTGDVLSDVKTFHVTVTATDSNGAVSTVKDVNGTLLYQVSPLVEYTVELDKIATYRVTYTSIDEYDNETTKICVVNAIEERDPIITVNGNLPTTWKLGTEVLLPTYTVDYVLNAEGNLSFVVCIAPNDEHHYIQDGKYTPTQKGEYIIRYVAMDVSGNSTVLEFKVICA